LNARLSEWMATKDAEEAASLLQQAGIPAARMLRVSEQPDYPYFIERGLFRSDDHALLPEPLISERRPAIWSQIPEPDHRPAPLMGENTFEVLSEWLQLEETELEQLLAEGTIETVAQKTRDLIADGAYRRNFI
ncbi:MAG: hypothetical protein HC938_13875, partial [Nitrospira sp.]|nr:hypothetical protein [Nitrospira sp.]